MSGRQVGDHVELDESEARSGQVGYGVRYILLISTLLVIAGFGATALFSSLG